MRGEQYVQIPIRGINNQLLDDQSVDGLCDNITNLKPKGMKEKPYWVPFEKLNNLSNDNNLPFSYEFGIISISDVFWQTRNFVGEYSDPENIDGSLKRLIVLCQNSSRKVIDIVEPDTWTVVRSQALPISGNYSMTCTRVNEVTVINIVRNKQPFQIFYLLDDTFIPQGWPELPTILTETVFKGYNAAEVEAGQTTGVQHKDTERFFMVTHAFRLFDGTYVKHGPFQLITVQAGGDTAFTVPKFTHQGYVEALLTNEPFWKSLISGVSAFATLPKDTKKGALDDGGFYEVAYWPWIDRLHEDQWPTVDNPNIITVDSPSAQWPTFRALGVDNFTHHRFSANVVDTYNSRLLLGGSSVDFALPRISTNAEQNLIDGGPYTDYMSFSEGSMNVNENYFDESGTPMSFSEVWDYDVTESTHSAFFNPRPGKEFKSVVILEQNNGTSEVSTPNGQSLPFTDYVALIDESGRLYIFSEFFVTSFGSGGSGYLPSPGAFMKLEVNIGPIGDSPDQKIIFTVKPTENTSPYYVFSSIFIEALNTVEVVGAEVFHIITLKTDAGTYQRISSGVIADTDPIVTLPENIWYPDRRATNYKLVVKTEGDYKIALDKQMISHPVSNYSYILLSIEEQVYTLGSSIIAATEPDFLLNERKQWVKNRTQASITNQPFIFDLAASYRVGSRERDTIMGFGVNLDKTTEGQFGQYPLYVFSDKGVWALEQISDPNIAFGKISPISNFNGLNNPFAIANAGALIVAADNKYIYSLAGNRAERIDASIANDPEYPEFLKHVRIGYHRANDYEELVFSNPFFDYSLYFNLEYGMWYKGTQVFRLFFNDFPELQGISKNNQMIDFSSKNSYANVNWSISTRPMILKNPYWLKRLFPSFIRCSFRQESKANVSDYIPVNAKLLGYHGITHKTYLLHDLDFKCKDLTDIRYYNQFGSLYAYRIEMLGSSTNNGSHLFEFDLDHEIRYPHRRRLPIQDIENTFFSGNQKLQLCLCNDNNSGDKHFKHIQSTAVSSILITHGLDKFPSVFVTDMEGFKIDTAVKQVNINQVLISSPDIPFTFIAYFN